MTRFLRFFLLSVSSLIIIGGADCAAQKKGREGGLGLKTVCIDAGHGGNDPGCISKDKKTREKNLTLDISKRVAEKIRAEYPGVKVILTRNTDVFVPLVERAQIANRANADLFISVHINSTTGTSANGHSVHVLGQSSKKGRDLFSNNFNECARENSVILLEDDYTTNYQGYDPSDPESSIIFSLMQNAYLEQSLDFADRVSREFTRGKIFTTNRGVHQDPFLVLWKTAMPAVLIECGFISNSSDLAVLRQDAQLDKIAGCIFNAFRAFKVDYDRSLSLSQPEVCPEETQETKVAPERSASTPNESASGTASEKVPSEKKVSGDASVKKTEQASAPTKEIFFGTQILALKRQLQEGAPELKGHSVRTVFDGNIYRYIAGASSTEDEARKKLAAIKADFPSAFLVKTRGDGSVERLGSK